MFVMLDIFYFNDIYSFFGSRENIYPYAAAS